MTFHIGGALTLGMIGMGQFSEGGIHSGLLRGLVAIAFLAQLPSFPASATQLADGGVEPTAVKLVTAPSEDNKVTEEIPEKLLRALLGCWQLDAQERWTISQHGAGRARVVRTFRKQSGLASFPDYARRAAIPSTLMYDAHQGNFAFSTAGRIHAMLVVFTQSGSTLETRWYSKHSPEALYAFTGNTTTLQRCKVPARARLP